MWGLPLAMSSRTFSLITAVTSDWGIGYKNGLPWPTLKEDLKFLRTKTTSTKDPQKLNATIVGRNTWNAVPPNMRPLPRRFTVVLSSQSKEAFPGAHLVCRSLGEAVESLSSPPLAEQIESIFILGGYGVYDEALRSPLCDKVYITHVEKQFPVDAYFPVQTFHDEGFKQISDEGTSSQSIEENGIKYRFVVYKK
ncbi:dihydrofolate reductase-like [Dysidea avara]|uniref:dihydrofolate reductase-like n=1 Tax=Dysidea avara TaxID=196820 RepID=UPI00331F3A2D